MTKFHHQHRRHHLLLVTTSSTTSQHTPCAHSSSPAAPLLATLTNRGPTFAAALRSSAPDVHGLRPSHSPFVLTRTPSPTPPCPTFTTFILPLRRRPNIGDGVCWFIQEEKNNHRELRAQERVLRALPCVSRSYEHHQHTRSRRRRASRSRQSACSRRSTRRGGSCR